MNNLINLESLIFKDTDFCKPFYSGVYFVCARTQYKDFSIGPEKILYIGSSNNIGKRLISNKHPYRLLFNKLQDHLVYTRSVECINFKETEIFFIKKFAPKLNKMFNPIKKNNI